ncbi:MAG: hypothetical protein ABMA25_04230 [Ilumatobacteraceae bacterium]
MNWTEERLNTALHSLDTIEADDAFWNDLHAQLHDGPSDREIAFREDDDTPRRRGRVLLAVAACLALVAGIAVAVQRANRDAAAPGPLHLEIVDPLGITLDDLPRTASAAPSDPDAFLVLDLDRLPAGWAAADIVGQDLSGDGSAYAYGATLLAPTGAEYFFSLHSVEADGIGASTGQQPNATVGGGPALLGDSSVMWQPADGYLAMVGAGGGDVIDVAEQLQFTTAAQPPIPGPDEFVEIPDDPQLAGLLDGVPWALKYRDIGPTAFWLYAATQTVSGGEHPADNTSAVVNLVGVQGHGAIVVGHVPTNVVSVRVVLRDGTSIDLPVTQQRNAVYFAVPVPLGLDVERIEFRDPFGPAGHVELPDIPPTFGGTQALSLQAG